ncbi:MAG: 16S rRNA (uracil(1498)-N(3))-methyltransferase [Lachnospiraceae bacterium]|nr:16S rRNA (uracil(1498)-N(3))-methyltransferase [Lachnospiraceae bacterium]
MYRFFVDSSHIEGKEIYIDGKDHNHIKNVLRLKEGEELSVMVEGREEEYRCEIASFEDKRVRLKLRFIKEDKLELPCRIYLFQGLPKSDKMEFIIQKAVELGVYEIIPVSMKRSVVKLEGRKKDSKVLRYNSISEAAAKQSKRAVIPRVRDIMTFKEALEYCEAESIKVRLLPYELHDNKSFRETRSRLEGIDKNSSIAVFIGPEGGFDDKEAELSKSYGFEEITLGKRILRTETAGMTILSWFVYLMEE